MATIVLYGASDDLVELEGDIREEWTPEGDTTTVAFSNGTVARITYDDSGFWRITVIHAGFGNHDLHIGADEDADYSDRLTITDDAPFKWVAQVTEIKAA